MIYEIWAVLDRRHAAYTLCEKRSLIRNWGWRLFVHHTATKPCHGYYRYINSSTGLPHRFPVGSLGSGLQSEYLKLVALTRISVYLVGERTRVQMWWLMEPFPTRELTSQLNTSPLTQARSGMQSRRVTPTLDSSEQSSAIPPGLSDTVTCDVLM